VAFDLRQEVAVNTESLKSVVAMLAAFYLLFVTGAAAQTQPSCTYFTVVTQDKLKNIKQGLSADDVKWFQKKVAKKYPGLCYAAPASTVPIVFYITVTPDVYHGTRVVNHQSTHSDPVSGTVTDQDGNTSQVSGTVETTTTSSTAVPYSVEYGIYTLSVERRRSDGEFDVAHRFQQKGLYNTLYGIPLGGKGHHPLHTVIEDAAKWINSGGLVDAMQSVLGAHPPSAPQLSLAATDPTSAPTTAATASPAGLVDVPFTSNPPGALVSFSGMAACYTPCSLKLEARRFRVTVTLPGYAAWTREIIVEAGKPVVAELQR
jgi:PEGA domain-containing protein